MVPLKGSGSRLSDPMIERPSGINRVLHRLGLKKPQRRLGLPPKSPAELPHSPNGLTIEKVPTLEEAKIEIWQEKSDRAEILQRLDVRDTESHLDKAYEKIAAQEKKPLSGVLFTERVLLGIDMLARDKASDKYKEDFFMRNGWFIDHHFSFTLENFMLAYHLGYLAQMENEFTPLQFEGLKKYAMSYASERPEVLRDLILRQKKLEKAIENQNPSELARIIHQVIYKANGEIELEIIKAISHEFIPALIAELENLYESQSFSISEAPRRDDKAQIITDILKKLPEALPYLLQRYSESYSPVEAAICRLLRLPRDFASQVLEPLITELIKSPEGEDYALAHIFNILSSTKIYSQELQEQLRVLHPMRTFLVQIIENILSRAEEIQTISYANQGQINELKGIITEIARENNLLPAGIKKIKPKTAKAILLMAVKIQLFTEFARNKNLKEASAQFKGLVRLYQTKGSGSLEIPGLELLRIHLRSLRSPAPSSYSENSYISYLILESVNGNMPSASRILQTLQENLEIWAALRALALNLSLNTFIIRYAYCFLAQNSGKEERTLENLKALLDEDKDGKHLFLTLQNIPMAIKGQSPNIYSDAFAQIAKAEYALEILLYWKLINTKGLNGRDQIDLKEITAKLFNFFRSDSDQGKGELWEKLIELAGLRNFYAVNEFFESFLKNIMNYPEKMNLVKRYNNQDQFKLRMAVSQPLDTINSALKEPS